MHLSEHCDSTDIKHEFAHALGLYHAHTRPDRDQYVQIFEDRIRPKRLKNFKICTKCWTYGTPYDVTSMMHYKSRDFSIDGLPTIESKVFINSHFDPEPGVFMAKQLDFR